MLQNGTHKSTQEHTGGNWSRSRIPTEESDKKKNKIWETNLKKKVDDRKVVGLCRL